MLDHSLVLKLTIIFKYWDKPCVCVSVFDLNAKIEKQVNILMCINMIKTDACI